MKILGWNCRGICNASTVKALRASIRVHHPIIVFLSETKASTCHISKVASLLGFSNFICVDSHGRSSGLCLLWENSLQVDVLEFDSNLIAITVHDSICDWNFVGFYGPPHKINRRIIWENLHALLESFEGPWVVLGDFNVILDDSEKEGGRIGCSSMPSYLKDLLFDLGAVDLGFAGNKFTWSNRRWGKGSIRERLDRGICNSEWRLLFPKAVILHLGAINSDHCPLLLDSNPTDYLMPRPFRFVVAWLRDPRCFEVIRLAWKKVFYGCSGLKLCRKQRATTSALKRWNKDEFSYCQTRISELTSQIEVIQSKEVSVTNARIEANLQSELNEWLTHNDLIWKQKSREI
jgi:exonuclease III